MHFYFLVKFCGCKKQAQPKFWKFKRIFEISLILGDCEAKPWQLLTCLWEWNSHSFSVWKGVSFQTHDKVDSFFKKEGNVLGEEKIVELKVQSVAKYRKVL